MATTIEGRLAILDGALKDLLSLVQAEPATADQVQAIAAVALAIQRCGESEARRDLLQARRDLLSADYVSRAGFLRFVDAVGDAVQSHVKDPAILYAIRQDVRAQLLRSEFVNRLGDEGIVNEIRKAGGTTPTNE